MSDTRLPGLVFSLLLVFSPWLASPADAAPYSSMYVFGDSLSDPGNLAGTSDQPSSAYAGGRFSNGPVAAEYLAGFLGISTQNFFDYAVYGATTGTANHDAHSRPDSGVQSQVKSYLSTHTTADPNGLYMIWAGPNDIVALQNPFTVERSISHFVSNILDEIADLKAIGARHFLVPNMADLGLTPLARSGGWLLSSAATSLSELFDRKLAQGLEGRSDVTQFDTFDLLRRVVDDSGSFGFANADSPCLRESVVCANPDNYLFWDRVHPTTAAHRLLANEFAEAVFPGGADPIPEPSIVLLMLICLPLLWIRAAGRRRMSAAAA